MMNTPNPTSSRYDPPEIPSPARSASVPIPLSRPLLAYVFLGLTIAVYLGQLASRFFFGFDLPLALGAKINEYIAAGEYWRLITPVFLHAGEMHIFFNMYALFFIGPEVERIMGHMRFFGLYLLSGFAGVVLSYLLSPNASVGASGAIFGLIGALAVFLLRHRHLLGPVGSSRLSNLAFIILANIAISFLPSIDLWGHMGGLVAGGVLSLLAGPSLSLSWTDSLRPPVILDLNSKSRIFLGFFLVFIILLFLSILPALI